jgi:O-antigen/teichoic acid export membrane protein
MSKETKLAKATAVIAVGQLCTKMVTFFLLPLYTSILSTEQYGYVDFIYSIVMLLVPLISFQFEQGVFRFLVEARNDFKKQIYYLSSAVFFILLILIGYTIIGSTVVSLLDFDYKYFIIILTIVQVITSIFLQIARGLGDNMSFAITSFINASTTVLFNVIFITYFKWNAYGMLLATFLGNVICILYIIFKCKLFKSIKFIFVSKAYIYKLLKYSVPLIPNAVSWWVINGLDRIIIKNSLGIEYNGIFSIAYKIPNLYLTVVNIFVISWTESASENIDSENRDKFYSTIMMKSIKMFWSLNLCIISIIPFVFRFLINSKFADAYDQLPFLMFGSLLHMMGSLYGAIYIALMKTKEIAKTTIVAGVINIIINLLLIKHIGLYAASIATMISYFVMTLWRHFNINKYIKIKLDFSFILLETVLSICSCIVYFIGNYYIKFIMLIFIIIITIYTNLDLVKSFLELFKRIFLKRNLILKTLLLRTKVNKKMNSNEGVPSKWL